MIYLDLFWTFFKIGLFSFGGGYVMIPLLQKEIEVHGWLAASEFADIVAISQMTPGPIAVNAATYIGQRTAGIAGSTMATLGVSLPSFILIIIVAHLFIKFKENQTIDRILQGIRPATAGLIASAVAFFAEMSIFTSELPLRHIGDILSGRISRAFLGFGLNFGALAIFLFILIAVKKYRMHPITAVIVSAVLGVLLV
jgi:chromate transporter